MFFEESESTNLKNWLVKRLEDISDADSDVLADYVLALIKSDDPEAQVKENCLENLKDFLGDNTESFVDDVFGALGKKSYLPGYVPPKPSRPLTATAPSFNPPSGPSFNPPSGPSASYNPLGNLNPANGNGAGEQSRKRTINDRDGSEPVDGQSLQYGRENGERAFKQSRRGGPDGARRGRGGYNGGGQNGAFQQPQIPQMPTQLPDFPPLDPNNPMAAILAMQAMGFPSIPGFPQFPGAGQYLGQSASPTGFPPIEEFPERPAQIGERCRDYDTKGYCAIGSMCPYEHGANRIVIPLAKPEYDPRNATLTTDFGGQLTPSFNSSRGQRGRGRGSNRGVRGQYTNGMRGGRAPFSAGGPNMNQNITKVVVEQIPEDKFNEDSIRGFFTEFGIIEEVNLQDYKRLAILRFADYASAKRAYESPKVIFDNRFVKVYWYKPELGTEEEAKKPAEDEEMIDPEEFAQKQAEAQRVHEEKARKIKEAETAREELEKKIKAQAEERKLLMEKLSAKAATKSTTTTTTTADGKPDIPATSATSTAPPTNAKISQTEALRAKLAELEAEAETLGLGPEDAGATPAWGAAAPPYRGRGGYTPFPRGGGYRGRGGARGGWRGFSGGVGGGAVARLDNRPKSVEVKALDPEVDFGEEKVMESLRAHLFGIGDFASITPSTSTSTTTASPPAQPPKQTATVTFNERYVAEIFINTSSHIPGIGATALAWAPNNPTASTTPAPAPAPASAPVAVAVEVGKSREVGGGGNDERVRGNGEGEGKGEGEAVMVDYDVADDEDEDRWMR